MGVNYNGDFTVPQSTQGYVVRLISSSTNAGPIVVTTTVNHGFATGDSVQIEGHTVNTNANGNWTITVLTVNTFSLNNSTGNGVGGATGYALDYAVNPLVTVPSGGDLRNASSVSSPLEAGLNMVPWLYQRTGAKRIYDVERVQGGTLFTGVGNTTLNNSTWTTLVGLGTLMSGSPNRRVLAVGDILNISFTSSVVGTTSNEYAVGAAVSIAGGAFTIATQSSVDVVIPAIGNSIPIAINYPYIAASAGTYDIAIQAICSSASPTLSAQGMWCLNVIHMRSNA